MALNDLDPQNLATLGAVGLFDAPVKPYRRENDMFNAMPLLGIPVILYNLIALASGLGASDPNAAYISFTQVLFPIPMPSHGTIWNVSIGDIVLVIGLICLFFEIVRSTASDQVAIMNHSFSLVVFILALLEFILWRPFGTSVFFLLVVMSLLDVVAGFIVTIDAARKDIQVGR